MAEKVTLKLTAAAAAYLRQDTPRETKLQAARGDIALSSGDLGTLLFFLSHDSDLEVKNAAIKSLRDLSESQLLAIAGTADTHPKILDLLAHLHYPKQAVAEKLASHPEIESMTLAFLSEKLAVRKENSLRDPNPETKNTEDASVSGMEEPVGVDEESEEFKSKYQLSMKLGIAEKIKIALVGDKEWRTLMIKDSNSLVSEAVLKNPRITEPEILSIVKSSVLSEEMLRIICRNKEWVKNYQIRKALVLNCKTPLQSALRFLATLTDKDTAILARSKNVSTIIATQARKLLLNKKR